MALGLDVRYKIPDEEGYSLSHLPKSVKNTKAKYGFNDKATADPDHLDFLVAGGMSLSDCSFLFWKTPARNISVRIQARSIFIQLFSETICISRVLIAMQI